MDRKKKLITLFLSSAVAVFWACGEGSINQVTDTDERGVANLLEKLDSTKKDYEKNVHEFVDKFLEYCNSKEGHKDGCEAEYKKSSSSKSGDSGSSKSSSSGDTSKSSSSGNGNSNTSSSKAGSSSSSGGTSNSSSSKPSSSSSIASSSSKTPETKGKCVLSEKNAYVGDEVIWRYLPDEGSLESAEFTWSFNDDDVKNGIVSGKVSGTGTPELLVKFSTKGLKTGPTLTFNGKGFDCEDVKVLAKDEPKSSSSEPESSSSEPESSSAKSSSSVRGYCAVVPHEKVEGFTFEKGYWKIDGAEVPREVYVDESVDLLIVDVDGNELKGLHQWQLRDASATIVSGEESGEGSTVITVKYSTPNSKTPTVTWNGKSMICDRNELDEDDFNDFIVVKSLPVSSSSETPVEDSSSSSGEAEEKSSSSKEQDFCELYPDAPECVF